MFRFVTAGESHGQALVAWVSGLPAGVPIELDFINRELHRRQLGYGRGGRQRIEKDQADFLAGVRHGKTIGAPIALRIENRDWKNWEKAMAVEDSEGAVQSLDNLQSYCKIYSYQCRFIQVITPCRRSPIASISFCAASESCFL